MNKIYLPYANFFFNSLLLIVIFILSYLLARNIFYSFYDKATQKHLLIDKNKLKDYAIQGLKQWKMEIYLGGGIALGFTVFGMPLFFILDKIEFLVIIGLGLVPLHMIFLTSPIKRYKILHKFINDEIQL
ncbi:hypothetical protein J7E18_08165 [Oceanobacillus sp. ISL-73]|nr:hypothetical protein [Oceanobacillus sp. ISL-73]